MPRRSASSASIRPREERQIPRPRRSDDARERPRNGHVAGDGHVEKGRVQLRRCGHHPHVTGERPSQTRTRARTVDRRDRDGWDLMQQRRDLELALRQDLVGSATGEVLQVGARTEGLAGSGENEDANTRIGRRLLERVVRLAHHLVGHPVHALGPIKGHAAQAVGDLVSDRVEVHQLPNSISSQLHQLDNRGKFGARFSISAPAPSLASIRSRAAYCTPSIVSSASG